MLHFLMNLIDSPVKMESMISVTILTKNSQNTLKATLDSLKSFPEVLIFDSGSTDATLDIANEYPNVKINIGKFSGFGPTHNTATSLASHDWILSIDSDEVLTSELSAEILRLNLNPYSVYQIERKNYFNGKWIRWCGGWHPDPVVRLYNRTVTRFTDDAVHERVIARDLKLIPLTSPLLHTPYLSMGDFLTKMHSYSTLFAEQHKGKKRSSMGKAIAHGWFAFFKSYFLKKGFLGGKEGFIISAYNGHTAFYKYMKLMEANRRSD
jgi:glycosyltransferase involved in cell wall biosynthesis